MEKIIKFIEENVDGKTLYTKELIYELENGALQGVYSDQISFSNLKYSQSGFQLDMFIVVMKSFGLWETMVNAKSCGRTSAQYPYFALNWQSEEARVL